MEVRAKNILLKNGGEVILRSPLVAETSTLLDHLRRCFRANYRNFNRPPDYFENMTVEEEAEIVKKFLESEKEFQLCAFSQNLIIGCLSLSGHRPPFMSKSASLGIGIENEFQGQGIGKHLLEYCLETAKVNGFRSIDLSVRTFNGVAIALYEKVGFRRVGEMKDIAWFDNAFHDEFIYQYVLK
ncbi:MAG: N-acetyltransferase family protein [Bacteriovoracia bacterium]